MRTLLELERRPLTTNEALKIIFNLLKNEGLSLGPSSGINIAGAVMLAKLLGPGHTIATILCDYGTRYHSKLFNPDFLKSKDLPLPPWLSMAPQSIPGVFEEM